MAETADSAHTAEIDACPLTCLNRLAPTCVIHRPSAENDAPERTARDEYRVTYPGNDVEDRFSTEDEAVEWAARWGGAQ